MVCPGVVRKAAKLVPTVLQAIAFVVCIHVVGQVICLFENQMTPLIITDTLLLGNVIPVRAGQVPVQQELPSHRIRFWVQQSLKGDFFGFCGVFSLSFEFLGDQVHRQKYTALQASQECKGEGKRTLKGNNGMSQKRGWKLKPDILCHSRQAQHRRPLPLPHLWQSWRRSRREGWPP